MHFTALFRRPAFGAALTVAVAGALTACASGGGSGGGGLFSQDPNRGVVQVQTAETIPTEMFLKQGYCPPVQIRPGTESFVVHERVRVEDQGPSTIRFQASISDTARECHAIASDTLSIKVGVRGRIAAGPKGGAGNITVPLRIAVVKQVGSVVLYSQKFDIPATFAAGQFSVDYQQVFDQVSVKVGPSDRDLIVYVGFDSGPPTS